MQSMTTALIFRKYGSVLLNILQSSTIDARQVLPEDISTFGSDGLP